MERWFAALTEKQIRRGAHRSTREPESAIQRYVDATNAAPKPFVWTKTADQIFASISRFCMRTSNSVHQGAAQMQSWGVVGPTGGRRLSELSEAAPSSIVDHFRTDVGLSRTAALPASG